MALTHFKIIEIMGGCDFHSTSAFFRIRIIITDNRNQPAHQRQNGLATDQMFEVFIIGMNGNGRIAQQGLRTGCGNANECVAVVRIIRQSVQRIIDGVEMARRLFIQ